MISKLNRLVPTYLKHWLKVAETVALLARLLLTMALQWYRKDLNKTLTERSRDRGIVGKKQWPWHCWQEAEAMALLARSRGHGTVDKKQRPWHCWQGAETMALLARSRDRGTVGKTPTDSRITLSQSSPRQLFWNGPTVFVLFKNKFYKKTVGISTIRTRIVRLEGNHADHLTTTSTIFITLVFTETSKGQDG